MSPEKGSKRSRRVGVEENLHATGAGSSRESLANARTPCACSRVTAGNQARNSSIVEPWSRCSNQDATGTRVLRKHHVPPSFPSLRSTARHRVQSISFSVASGYGRVPRPFPRFYRLLIKPSAPFGPLRPPLSASLRRLARNLDQPPESRRYGGGADDWTGRY